MRANRLALGTVQFGLPYGVANGGKQVALGEARRIVEEARGAGMDTLDTAMAYGTSEAVLGGIGVDEWRIITKLPGLPEGCPDIPGWIRTSVHESLARLGVTHLAGLLLHRPLQLLEPAGAEIYGALLSLKRDDVVEKIGFSIYSPGELDGLWGRYPVDIVQAPFSILDRRLDRSGWLDRLSAAGVAVHARSVFLQGLLLMGERDRPVAFHRWSGLWASWHSWLRDRDLSPLEACLAFALGQERLDRVIVGVDTTVHLQEIIAAARENVGILPEGLASDDLDLLEPSRWLR